MKSTRRTFGKWILRGGILVPFVAPRLVRAATIINPYRFAASGGLASFSDNFTRANSDSLGANWTEIAGDIDIVSNAANAPATYAWAEKAAIYTSTACATADQYAKVEFAGDINNRPGIIFRFTDSSSPYYQIRFQAAGPGSNIQWLRIASAGGSETSIDSISTFDNALPIAVGVTVSGVGNATVVNCWNNPTADAPTTASLWDGSAPAVSLTANPGSPVDSGGYIGIGGIGAGAPVGMVWDNFFAGDIP